MKFTIKYQYGSYSGTRVIYAEDQDSAVRKMWASLRKDMSLPMASQSHTIIKEEDEDSDNF